MIKDDERGGKAAIDTCEQGREPLVFQDLHTSAYRQAFLEWGARAAVVEAKLPVDFGTASRPLATDRVQGALAAAATLRTVTHEVIS